MIVLRISAQQGQSSYSNFELGFYQGLIENDRRAGSRTARRIYYVVADERTPTNFGSDRIQISVPFDELTGSRELYLQSFEEGGPKADDLTRLFREISELARSRANRPVGHEMERNELADTVRPVRGAIFESLRGRIVSEATVGGDLDVELPQQSGEMFAIPDNAQVYVSDMASQYLGLPSSGAPLLWRDFKKILSRESSLLYVIEAMVAGSVRGVTVNPDPVVVNRQTFLIFPVRYTRYFDGRARVRVCLALTTPRTQEGDRETSLSLSYLTKAVRYRGLFDLGGSYSVRSFSLVRDLNELKDLTQKFVQDLKGIEAESVAVGLDEPRSISMLFGGVSVAGLRSTVTSWEDARIGMLKAASSVLNVDGNDQFETARDQLIEALEKFSRDSSRYSSFIGLNAIQILRKKLEQGGSPITPGTASL